MDAQTIAQILAEEAQREEVMAYKAHPDDRERLEPRHGHAAHEGWTVADD